MGNDLVLEEFRQFVRSVTGETVPAALLATVLKAAQAEEDTKPKVREIDPETLRKADFVKLPLDVARGGKGGTRCDNCIHDAGGVCNFHGVSKHSGLEIDLRGLKITSEDCCAEWDAPGTDRSMQASKTLNGPMDRQAKRQKRAPWYVTKRPGPFEYSTMMLRLADAHPVASKLVLQLAARIPDDALATHGREDDPHVTVKYGLMTSDPEEVHQYVRSYGRVHATLGKTNFFAAPEHDVVYVEVLGNSVRDLNVLVDGSVPNEDEHPIYQPHVTVAYVRPGTGAKYRGLTDLEGIGLEWDTLVFCDPAGRETRIKLDDPEAPSEPVQDPKSLLGLPDIRQEDDYSCGAACAMAVGRYFSVGPGSLDEWKRALGTTKETSTLPVSIVQYLRTLGLSANPHNNLTLEDLSRAWREGKPVICCIQEYGVPSKQASYKYGHYVVVVGRALGHVFVQDPSADNALGRPGGSQGPEGGTNPQGNEVEDPDSLNAPGRNMIPEATFLRCWHDEDVLSNKYETFGIIVGPPAGGTVAQSGERPPRGQVAGSIPAGPPAGLSKAAGTCKPGQTRARTGCTPATDDGGKGGKSPPAPGAKPENRAAYEKRTGKSKEYASYEEYTHSRKLAAKRISEAPTPDKIAVAKAKKEMELARKGKARAGGESRGGSAADRRRQRENILKVFDPQGLGYCACHGCGRKVGLEDNEAEGIQRLERGKIFVKCQGGGYQLANILPECFGCNRSRNDDQIRKENPC